MFKTYTANAINEDSQIIGCQVLRVWFFTSAATAHKVMNYNSEGWLIDFRRV